MEIGTYCIFCPCPLFEGLFTSVPHNLEGFLEAHRTSHSGAGRVSPDVQDERHVVVKNIGLRGRQTGYDLRLLLTGISLVVQWLKLHAPNAEGPGLIPGEGIRFHRQN